MSLRRRATQDLPAAFIIAALLALLWLGLAEGEGWWFGGPAILAVVLMTLHLSPVRAQPLHPLGLLRFVAYFISQSLYGGLDVAGRALHPRLPLLIEKRQIAVQLPDGPARTVLVGTISLLPGTLAVDLEDDLLTVHGIAGDPMANIRRLEKRVADLFGLPDAGMRI